MTLFNFNPRQPYFSPKDILIFLFVKNLPIEIAYHDSEWGVPIHDDQQLFEFLLLEGAQAGLSWTTVLKKREYYRQTYDGFNPVLVAQALLLEKDFAHVLNLHFL